MNVEELLEFAAKAAGIVGEYVTDYNGDYYYQGNTEGILYELPEGGWYVWNPLLSDGDALRLVVLLKFDLWNSNRYKAIAAGVVPEDNMFDAKLHSEWKRKDSYAATRRAIVRAAAEIGRGMK